MTADALNCPRAIASQIIGQGGDHALALKGSQPTLHADVSLFLDDPGREASDTDTTVDAGNGRIETRTATVTANIGWLQHSRKWPGLKCIGKVTRTRETAAKTTAGTAYYLLSAERFNAVARSHWGVENRLHWRLDVIMNEDQDRNRMDNSPYNLAILRHMALNVMQKEGSKGSLRGKFKRAGWNDGYLRQLLAAF